MTINTTFPSESKRSVYCRFETQYMCGYDTHPFEDENVIWKRKYDGGFILKDATWARGKISLNTVNCLL